MLLIPVGKYDSLLRGCREQTRGRVQLLLLVFLVGSLEHVVVWGGYKSHSVKLIQMEQIYEVMMIKRGDEGRVMGWGKTKGEIGRAHV